MPRAPISSTRKRVSRVGLEHRVRQAELVVERAGRRDGRAEPGQQLGDQVLGGGLAGRAGDADDGQIGQPVHHGPGQPAHRGQRVVHQDGRAPATSGSRSPPTAPAATAASAKSCPSTFSPAKATNSPPGPTRRESNSTGPDLTASRRAGQPPHRAVADADRPAATISPAVIGIMPGPPRTGRQRLGQLDPVVERVTSRRPTPGRVSCPLPSTATTSPGSASRDRLGDRLAPAGDLDHGPPRLRPARRRAPPPGPSPGPPCAGCRR